jgi:hypothetical protein
MSAECYLSANVTIHGPNVADGQRCNLPDAQTAINGQHKAKTISFGVACSFGYPKHAADFGFIED